MLWTHIVCTALVSVSVSASVQQTCHGFDGWGSLIVETSYNSSLLIYELSDALNKTSIPQFIDDSVVEGPDGSISMCTLERKKAGDDCQGLGPGEFVFEGHKTLVHYSRPFSDNVQSTDGTSKTGHTYSVPYTGNYCVVLWRPNGRGFSDVYITEKHGIDGTYNPVPIHWRERNIYNLTWFVAFLSVGFFTGCFALVWGISFLNIDELVALSDDSASRVTAKRITPALAFCLQGTSVGLLLESVNLLAQSVLVYMEHYELFVHDVYWYPLSPNSVVLPVRTFCLGIYRIHYSNLAWRLWNLHHGYFPDVYSKCPGRYSQAGARVGRWLSQESLTLLAIWIELILLQYVIHLDVLRIIGEIVGLCADLFICFSLLIGLVLVLCQVFPWKKHSVDDWVMYIVLTSGVSLLTLSLLLVSYDGQKHSLGCMFPGHGQMLYFNAFLWDYQSSFYHNSFEFEYEYPSDWLHFYTLLPSMIPAILWFFVALVGGLIYFVRTRLF